jgi:hypothetical protein
MMLPAFPDGPCDNDELVKVTAADTTAGFLGAKLVAGTNVTITTNNPGANETLTITAAGGVTGFTGSVNTASPNNVVNAARLLVDVPTTNGDLVLQPKGAGAIIVQVPTSSAIGGNKRGVYALDFVFNRQTAADVASGLSSFSVGEANECSGMYAVSIGRRNYATNPYSIAFGNANNVSSTESIAAGGNNNTINVGSASGILGGRNNTCGANFCAIMGGDMATATRHAQRSHSAGRFTTAGDCQEEQYICRTITSNATPTDLTLEGTAPNIANRILIPSDTTCTFVGIVTARRTDVDGETAGWEIKGVIRNDAGTTAAVGTFTITQLGANAGNTWSLAVTADNTNDALVLTGTGESGKTIRWGATITLMKISG